MRTFWLGLTLVAAVSASFARRAEASGDADLVGVACLPDAQAVYNGDYLTSGGTIKDSGTNRLIRMYCQIPSTLTSPTHLFLEYKRETTSCFIGVTYRRIGKSDGDTSGVIKAFSATGTSTSPAWIDQTFTDTFDQSQYVYLITVELQNGAAGQCAVYGVTVW